MNTQIIAQGVVHTVPDDMLIALTADDVVRERWDSLTPLARNEWICWSVTCKKPETRAEHIKRTAEELKAGKRRPCCWAGCPHRQKS